MKTLALAALLMAFSAQAQVHPSQQAATVAKQCAELSRGSAGKSSDQMVCATRFAGFLAGWNAGIRRGIRSAFVLDPQNINTTKGADDVYTRAEAIQPAAQCLGKSGTSFLQFIERYVNYVVARTDRATDQYDEVLTEMIEETLCR